MTDGVTLVWCTPVTGVKLVGALPQLLFLQKVRVQSGNKVPAGISTISRRLVLGIQPMRAEHVHLVRGRLGVEVISKAEGAEKS